MNLRDLKYFITLAQVRHFKKASEICCVSQPTLSMQIKKLETELNITLFERDKRDVKITLEGEQLLRYAQQIQQLYNDMKQHATTLQDPFSGNLKLGLFPTLAPFLLPKIINPLQKACPKLNLQLHEEPTDRLITQLDMGQLDAIIIADDLLTEKFHQHPLFDETLYLACHKNHALNQQPHVAHKKIPENEFLFLNEGHCLRDQGITFCQHIGKQHNTQFHGSSLSTIMAMIALDKGISLIPSLATSTLKQPNVQFLPFKSQQPKRTLYLAWRKSANRKPLLNKVKQVVQHCLKKTTGIKIID